MSENSSEQGLRNRLRVIDIPICYQRELAQLVTKWSQCSGIEWAIRRLKSLKVDLFRRKAGLPLLTVVRKNRKGDVAGCIGGLFRFADKSEKNFRKVVQSLMCYTVWKYSKPTKSQLKKFSEALSSPPPITWRRLKGFHKAVKRNFGGLTVDRKEDVSLLLYRGSPSIRKPSVGMRSVSKDSNILADGEILLSRQWGIDLVQQFQDLFDPVFEGLDFKPIQPFFSGKIVLDPFQIIGGKIAFLQEAGGKLRSVASPFQAYQLALQHFGRAVYDFCRIHLSWDCTHDQSKPVHVLQDALRKGKTVHSVDLSSATDYFPLEFQSSCMRALFGNISDISLFETISRSTWFSPIGPVRWNRGQPLGLYPSFAVFTVSHGMLLWYLNSCSWNEDFYVLGDDVVILDDNLYQRYIDTLQSWGCPYSPDKSLSSSQICEFAGKVITSESVTSQLKWRETSNDNFIDICRQLGPRSRTILSERQKEVFDRIKHCAYPIGLGFSYPGSTLVELEANAQELLMLSKETVLDSLMDLTGVVYRNLYGSNLPTNSQLLSPTTPKLEVVLEKVATFDKKVRLVLSKLLSWFHSESSDPRLYSGVPRGLGNTEIPPVQLLPSRRTTLDRYRHMLGLTS